jgi:hypothetical protein
MVAGWAGWAGWAQPGAGHRVRHSAGDQHLARPDQKDANRQKSPA